MPVEARLKRKGSDELFYNVDKRPSLLILHFKFLLLKLVKKKLKTTAYMGLVPAQKSWPVSKKLSLDVLKTGRVDIYCRNKADEVTQPHTQILHCNGISQFLVSLIFCIFMSDWVRRCMDLITHNFKWLIKK